MSEVLRTANPEWVAKRLIIEHYNRASTLMGLAAIEPRQHLAEFKASVVALYGFIREKMYKYHVGVGKEKLEKYDNFLKDRKTLMRASYGEIVEWFFDVQKAVERLGYTKFERQIDIEKAMEASRGG